MSDAAIATLVTGMVTVVTTICGVVTLWIKLRENNKKIDANTAVTVAGTTAAATNAAAAASAANTASEKTDSMVEKLNGELDNKIAAIVKAHADPIVVMIHEHTKQDDKNMLEIRKALGELRDKVSH